MYLCKMLLPAEQRNTAGIYLHIPFCKKACAYCNFHFSTSTKNKDELLQAMMLEAELQRDFLEGRKIETIYFGGGTPSLLSADEINRLYERLATLFATDNLKEVTLEANPDDLNAGYLRSLKGTPVNRLSIGVQSFRDVDLRYMGRAHNAQEADRAVKTAQDTGFELLTIDLIYGVPGMDDDAWKDNLRKVGALGIPHFSAYALTVEERTALQYAIQHKKAAPIDAGQAADQFGILTSYALGLGYEHYEISNLAKPGAYAVHNTNYWRGLPYLGLGPSAHSFDGRNTRRWNVSNNAVYTNELLKERKIAHEEEQLSDADRLNEYLMTSLRTQWGCDLKYVSGGWGATTVDMVLEAADEHLNNGKMLRQGDQLLLTTTGMLYADGIAADLFVTGR